MLKKKIIMRLLGQLENGGKGIGSRIRLAEDDARIIWHKISIPNTCLQLLMGGLGIAPQPKSEM